ncbi:hypothetical protein X777_03548 [Ooceraea biroi]|uniref:Uncharacterized protein n=1 Tax=Ooceraea biroi TaxID=2015173 RepID=A0A026WKN1_OOCBI|nr:hypothetical protein X777_03548 [Ooceraea biroi]
MMLRLNIWLQRRPKKILPIRRGRAIRKKSRYPDSTRISVRHPKDIHVGYPEDIYVKDPVIHPKDFHRIYLGYFSYIS